MKVRQRILCLLVGALIVSGAVVTSNITTFNSTTRANVSNIEPAQEIERISIDELKQMIERNQRVTIIDTRSESQYNAGHIRGAIRAPLNALEAGLADIPRDREIVTYCA